MTLDGIIVFIQNHIITGMGHLMPYIWSLFTVSSILLIVCDLSLYEGDLRLTKIFRAIFMIGGFMFILNYFPDLISALLDTFKQAGVIGAGLNASNTTAYTPDAVLETGTKLCSDMLQALLKCSVMDGLMKGLVYLFACLAIVITTGQIALSILMTEIGFMLLSLVGLMTVPFGLIPQTKFLFENFVKGIFATSIKMMVMYLLFALYTEFSHSFSIIPADADFATILDKAIKIAIFSYVVYRTPDSVASMFGDGQVFQAGGVAGAAVGLANAATSKPVTTAATAAVTRVAPAVRDIYTKVRGNFHE